MEASTEKRFFNSANAYYEGAKLLIKPADTPARSLIQPALTCASLSLKLLLKCLMAIEGKDNEDSVYRIADLYQSLKDGTKKSILRKFDEFSNTTFAPEELVRRLEALDNAFIRWRYLHEEGARSVNLEDLDEMILAVKGTILELNPDWQSSS